MKNVNNFFPVDFAIPVNNPQTNYYKPITGENSVRILDRPVFGWEWWIDKKPQRFPYNEKPVAPVDADQPKFLMKLKIWDYADSTIKIWEVTSITIQRAIQNLSDNKNWGDPREFDLTIKKSGSGLDTKYSILPNPKAPLSSKIQELSKTSTINLNDFYNTKKKSNGSEFEM
jgi:hypothetical protein